MIATGRRQLKCDFFEIVAGKTKYHACKSLEMRTCVKVSVFPPPACYRQDLEYSSN